MNHRSSLLLALLALVAAWPPASAIAQTASEVWQDVDEAALAPMRRGLAIQRNVAPLRYRTLHVDDAALGRALSKAPREFTGAARGTEAEFFLPMPDGSFARCAIEDSPIVEPGLEAKHPEFKTYIARGLDDPSLSARIDRTPQGFHAIIFSSQGTSYIDPYWRNDTSAYVAYREADYSAAAKPFNCLVPGEQVVQAFREYPREAPRPTGATLQVYRLAVATTGEYSHAVGGGTVNGTLGAIITTVNRVSGLYERDFSIRFLLIANEEAIIFTDGTTDPYTNNSSTALLTQNQTTCDTIIGDANYDIGHVFSTAGGGRAGLAVVGKTGSKARGETGLSNPIGDPYDIDYVAHEMGHQFGGNHPFNSLSGSCSGNRVSSVAYEPGSGTTIMAYAGICSPQDLAPHSDDYFHTGNYSEIDTYTSTSPGAALTQTPTGNTPPTIGALTNYTVPCKTPFALTASATDPDNDVLTYCWEEFDLGPAQDPTADPRDNGSSPIFRSYAPTTNPTRIFPALTYILSNTNVPPAKVASFATGEFLPTTGRTMNFRVTVRDNHAGAGGSNYASTTVTSVSTAGPFAITSHANPATIAAGSTQKLTWSVAKTTDAPINCANVKISLSTDGGHTFPFVLAESTPNDGGVSVKIPKTPNIVTTQGRIKVEAIDNIFFDISDADLTITSSSNAAPLVIVTDPITVQRGSPNPVVSAVGTVGDYNPPLTLAVTDVPDDATVTASLSGNSIVLNAIAQCSLTTTLTSRTYPITLTVTDSLGAATSQTVNLVVQPNPSPTVGTYPDISVAQTGTFASRPSALLADANNNLGAAPVTVTPSTLPGGGSLTADQVTGIVTVTPDAAATPGTYPIKVTISDSCGATVVRTFNVTVDAFQTNTTPTLDSILNQTVNEDAGTQGVGLTGIGAGGSDSQALMVTATSDNLSLIPNPSISYTSPDSTGTLNYTPVANASGTAIITVKVRDNGGTAGGVDLISQSFMVTVNSVNDAPTLDPIATQAAYIDGAQQTVNLSGISAGGGESQTLIITALSNEPGLIPHPVVSYTSANATGSLTFTPVAGQSGTAIITVQVMDNGGTDFGGVDTLIRQFTINVILPDTLLGTYNGLALPAPGIPNRAQATGLIHVVAAKKGAVTAKLSLGGNKYSVKGVVNAAGDVIFGKAPGSTQVDLKLKNSIPLKLSLRLDPNAGQERCVGTVIANGLPFAEITADSAIYSKTNLFPEARIVPYTEIFDQPIAPGIPATGFPHGDGFGVAKISKLGVVKLTGTLADGMKFSYSNALSNGDYLPFWVPFFKGTGALVGTIQFVTVTGTSDFASTAPMQWFRPATAKGPFPSGWNAGITTDLRGSTYIVTKVNPACLPTLGANDANGNAALTLTDGKLNSSLAKALGIDPAKNKVVTIPPPGADKLKLTIAGKTGLFSGTFMHPQTQKTTSIKGAIFQKQAFGSGFFLSTDANKDTQSGGVSLTVKDNPP